MAAPTRTEDLWRRRWRWRRDDGDLDDDDDKSLVASSTTDTDTDTDTEEYYNRHFPTDCDDEADSGCKGVTSVQLVVPSRNGGHLSPSSSVTAGWGGTGKRGRSGLGTGTGVVSVSPRTEPDHKSMAAAPKPVPQPVPLAFAPPSIMPPSSSVPTASQISSAQSVHHDAVDTVMARAGGAATSARRPSPCDEAAIHHHQNPDGYTCPKCGKWFATHQGLGGHSVGHKHRESRERMLAVAGGRGRDDDANKRRERVHVCGDCGAEFATGVQLGGHKRKHWTGAPIVPKKKPRAVVAVLERPLLPPPAGSAARVKLKLALALKADEASLAAVPPVVEPESAVEPAARSPVSSRLRLFGVDIEP